METLHTAEDNNNHRVGECFGVKTSSSTASPKQIADPVVYKLVRVEGDGRFVPATDDEVMEVEELLEDEKGEVLLIAETGQAEGCISNEGLPSGKANLEGSEGLLHSENADSDAGKLNARLEYIEEVLQKVKQEERLRLSSDYHSDYMNIDNQCSDQHDKLFAIDEKLQSGIQLQEIVSSMSPRLANSQTNQSLSAEAYLKPKDGPVNSGSSPSADCSGLRPDFSTLKGEICLDNLTIRELHETFKATFGRETSVKDKLWLKRRIAMGLTNSCDVSTTTFIIKDKTLVKKVQEEKHKNEDTVSKDPAVGVINDDCKESQICQTDQIYDRQCISGKRLRKPNEVYDCRSEDSHTEQEAAKRVRKPTRRYIEELSEFESRECGGRLVHPVKNSGLSESSPRSCVRPFRNVGSDGKDVVTRQDSLGGSGIHIPFVSRVRRGRPRENLLTLLKYHPSGISMAAKVVKKAHGVHASKSDYESGNKIFKARSSPKHIEHVIGAETDEWSSVACMDGQKQDVEQKNFISSENDSDDNIMTVPTAKGGTRRKHHRAWTLSEVMKLVEGVARYGAGRWSEIKRLAFSSYTYRTSVDLKDKWRNLLRASFAQAPADKGAKNSRKHASMPIPPPILTRVRELAEMHTQGIPSLSSSKLVSRSTRGVHETRSGYL